MNKKDLATIQAALQTSYKVRKAWKRDADGNRTPAQRRAALKAAKKVR